MQLKEQEHWRHFQELFKISRKHSIASYNTFIRRKRIREPLVGENDLQRVS